MPVEGFKASASGRVYPFSVGNNPWFQDGEKGARELPQLPGSASQVVRRPGGTRERKASGFVRAPACCRGSCWPAAVKK